MYPFMKFQSTLRTSASWMKFSPKNMNEKNFEKINVKIVISI